MHIIFLLNLLGFFLLMLLISHSVTRHTLGEKTANRAAISSLSIPVAFFAIFFLMSAIGEENAWAVVMAYFILSKNFEMVRWLIQRRRAGAVLLSIGQVAPLKRMTYVGLYLAALTLVSIFKLLLDSPGNSDTISTWEKPIYLVFAVTMSFYFISLGLRKLEIIGSGISYGYSLFKWKRIRSFDWEQNKPNTLVIYLKSFLPFFNDFRSMVIPSKYRDSVDSILRERLALSEPRYDRVG